MQSLMLLATFGCAWVLYYRLTTFLKPLDTPKNDEEANEDDDFEDPNKSAFEVRRDTFRKSFKPKYYKMNVALIYLLTVLTIRVVTYVMLRLTSESKMFDWLLIKPSVFYITYVTDLMILVGTLYFIWNSTTLKEKYQGQLGNSEASIFPSEAQGSLN